MLVSILTTYTCIAQDLSQYGYKKGIVMTGGLNFNTNTYISNNQLNARDPFNWFLSGNVSINAFGYNLPFSFSLSNASKSYTQPFNRIQFKPYWKWIKAYWGSTSMTFSPLTLSGHVFNGYGIELTRNKWQFAAMQGTLREPIAYDAIIKNTSSASFKRTGFGFKGTYRFKPGDEISIIFFSAKDDSSSLNFVPLEANLTPKKNYVGSISVKKKILKKINFQLEYAVSGIVSDLTAATKPTVPSTTFLGGILPQKNNVVFYDAFKGSFGYQGKKYAIQLQYERITPEYQTFGAYFFNNDIRNITIAPTFTLFKGKVNVGANIGVQKNNLDNTKNSTSKRFVGSGSISYTKNKKWSFNTAFNNFSSFTNIRPQFDPLATNNPLDTLNFYQVNSSVNFSINHSFGTKEIPKGVNLNLSYQKASDQQASTQKGTSVSNFITGSIAYNQNFTKKNLTLSGAANINISNAPGIKTIFLGPNLNASTAFLKKLIKTNGGISYNKNISNGQTNSDVWSIRLNCSYAPATAKKTNDQKGDASKVTASKDEVEKKSNKQTTTLIKVKNPLKGQQHISLNMVYMSRLSTAAQQMGISELTINLNWSYSF